MKNAKAKALGKKVADRFATSPFAAKYADTNKARELSNAVDKLHKGNALLKRK